MREDKGDLFTYEADYRVITTNGFIKKNGHGVMGAGVALQAKIIQEKYELEKQLGCILKFHGNHVHTLFPNMYTFPVKHNWYEKADIELIKQSCTELAAIANNMQDKIFAMPRPGCGNGGLDWNEVKPVIENLLPDNIIIIYNA